MTVLLKSDYIVPGLRTPVWAIGPSSMILLTRMCPAADFMVQPIPLTGSFIRVIRFSPARGGEGGREGGRGREGDKYFCEL